MGCCGAATRIASSKCREPPVEEFKGPVRDRGCRDVIFLFLFTGFLSFLGYVLVTAAMLGDPNRLIRGTDRFGNVCGRNNRRIPGANQSGKDMTDSPYQILQFLPRRGENWTESCIAECPEHDYTPTALWRCIPKDPHVVLLLRYFNVTQTFVQELGSDLRLCWQEMLYSCLSALALALAMLLLLRFLAGVIIWAVLLLLTAASLAGTSFLWYQWLTIRDQVSKGGPVPSPGPGAWLAGAIAASIVTAIYLLLVLIMRKRIQLVAALFREAGKAIAAMPLLVFQPLVTLVSLVLIVGGWSVGGAYILTAQEAKVNNETGEVVFWRSNFYEGMLWYHLFALFWLTQICVACQHMIIAGAVVEWFFARDKEDLGWPILRSLRRLVCYHLGSVAFGALLVAILQLVRAIFKWLDRKLNQYHETLGFLLKCCRCCLYCFEKFLVYINRNAYIEIAIFGYSFCKGAQEALRVLAGNALRVAAVSSVGDFVLFLGKAGVVVSTAVIGYQLVKGKAGLHYVWAPIVPACAFALLISHCFLAVYEMAIDTLFLCFCEDCEHNDGVSRPYFMSKGLMSFVDKSRRIMGGKGSGSRNSVSPATRE